MNLPNAESSDERRVPGDRPGEVVQLEIILLPVHPKCRVIYFTDIHAYTEKLARAGELVALQQLKGAL